MRGRGGEGERGRGRGREGERVRWLYVADNCLFFTYKDAGKAKAALIGGTVAAGTFGLVIAIALAVLAVKYRFIRQMVSREKVGEINAEDNTRKKSYVTEYDKGVCDEKDTKC